MKQKLFLGKIVEWCQLQYNRNKTPFITAVFVGALTYAFAFTNKLINHDEVGQLFSKGASMSSGRWGIDLLSYVFPDYSMPWIYGVVSVAFIAISGCIIVNVFSVRNKVLQGLLVGLIIAFPSLIGTFTYMFTSSSYALAFLFSVIAVWQFSKKSVKSKLCALVFMVLSLGIYQAYVAVSASLFLLLVLQRTIRENGKSVEIIKEGVLYVMFLGVSLVCYYGITQLLLTVTHTAFNTYASSSIDMSNFSIVSRLKSAYISFKDILLNREYGLIATEASKNIHIICLGVLGLETLILWTKKKWQEKMILVIGLILFPLSINCMFLFTDAEAIHTLVLYSFISVYVFATIIIDENMNTVVNSAIGRCWHSITRQVITIAMLFVVITNVYVGNQTYLHLHLKYENAYAFYNALVTEVKLTPGFDENSKLAIVGDAYYTIRSYSEFENIRDIAGANGFWVNTYSRNTFIRNYIGFDVPFATDSEIEEIKSTSDFAEMEVYPYYGSIDKIGDYIVVKFSE